jgi:hypothetical protein
MTSAQSVQRKVSSQTFNNCLVTALVLAIALVAYVGTDRWFSVLEDETMIVNAARVPIGDTVRLFWNDQGPLTHPPLSDILLHLWLPIGGAAQWSLRLLPVLFYFGGLLVFALVARDIGGASAFRSLLALGLLWPFGFHFGRLVGWYSVCFCLVALVTLTYLRYVKRQTGLRLAVFLLPALCLIYCNYYGWAVIGCLAIDLYVRSGWTQSRKFLLITFATLFLAYTPMWIGLVRTSIVFARPGGGPHLTSTFLLAAYHLYSLFISESVAPWFWYFSVPACICIAISILLAVMLNVAERRFMIYFSLLFAGIALLGIGTTKRLLFISGWLLLAFALALSNREKRTARNILIVALTFIAAIGWIGTVTRRYYAAPHFIEPWGKIADKAAVELGDGAEIVTNSPSFRFYLQYSLQRTGVVSRSSLPGWVEHRNVIYVGDWEEAQHPRGSVLFVKGVNTNLVDQTERVEEWLRHNCVTGFEQQLVPDSGSALKRRLFSDKSQPPFRISLEQFDCSGSI